MWMEQTQKRPSTSLDHPPTFLPVATFRAIFLSPGHPTSYLELSSLLPSTPSFHICQNCSTKGKGAINPLVSKHLHASHTYLSQASISTTTGQLWIVWASSLGPEEKHKHAGSLWKILVQYRLHALFQDMQKPSQDEWRNTLDTMETSLVLENNPKQALLVLYALGCAPADPHLYDFLSNRVLEEQVKLIKKMDNPLTNLCKLAGPQPGLGERLL
ncbi:ferritin light chain-like [Acinonyx jubatus]|uniref:Ferritin n=1 Tax=Acinonyx jubatus TaxID=32536 RepID=A0ABM3NXN5_ACIJB|nr:ferritin light chain-like [Acinonyx jubatus]